MSIVYNYQQLSILDEKVGKKITNIILNNTLSRHSFVNANRQTISYYVLNGKCIANCTKNKKPINHNQFFYSYE